MRLRVDFKSGQPVHAQLTAQIRGAIASGALRPAEPLPAVADLAADLRVNRNNVAKAYSELESLGIIELVPDKGYCLKEQHRPIRKGIARIADSGVARPRLQRTFRQRFARGLPGVLATLICLAFAGMTAGTVLAYLPHNEMQAITATLVIAALFLLLRRAIASFTERRLYPKRGKAALALQSLKDAPAGVNSLLERIAAICKENIGVTPSIMREHAEVAACVDRFPALRMSLGPVTVANDLLMPLFSQDELIAILELKPSGRTKFDSDDWELLMAMGAEFNTVAGRVLLRKERAESEYALDIQRGLLPQAIPQVPGFTISGAWQPAKDVGGDYYDVFRLNQDQIALVVADVSGKGAPAALLMSNVQATTKAYATVTSSPRELCRKVNAAICASITAGRFITFFFAVLDTRTRLLTYCNAGHNPPLIVSNEGDCHKLDLGGTVLGLFAEAEYQQAEIQLRSGDRLVMFTDGVIEAADSHEREFGDDRLFTALTANANASAADLRDSIMQAVTRFCNGDFSDDATLLIVVADASESVRTAAAK